MADRIPPMTDAQRARLRTMEHVPAWPPTLPDDDTPTPAPVPARPPSRKQRPRVGTRLYKLTAEIPYDLYKALQQRMVDEDTSLTALVERFLRQGLADDA